MTLKSKSNEETPLNIRASGILVHPTSFPSLYPIGDLGQGAYNFIDFLEQSNQQLWQILPIGPTGFGDSPYQLLSSFAGQPLIISPDKLVEDEILSLEDINNIPSYNPNTIDYEQTIHYKFDILRKAYNNFMKNKEHPLQKKFKKFIKDNANWLNDYSLFMSVKDYNEGKMWVEWDDTIKHPTKEDKAKWSTELAEEIGFYNFMQFIFFKQWNELKTYANGKNIKIIGDIPIFVAYDSADVWGNKNLFLLNSKGYPTEVAGVPPDYFSSTGQLWGNALYKWIEHKNDGYKWWISRIKHQLNLFDYIRIDHFRGFDSYWAIPYGSDNAVNGKWKKGPGKSFFNNIKKALGDNLPIIAEDLGFLSENVFKLRDTFKLPGMKILQFGFESLNENDYLPHNISQNSVCYTGTHDNDTTLGWYNNLSEECKDKIRRYMNTDANDVCWDFIRTAFSSVSSMAIIPIQDIMSLDSSSRLNTPGTQSNNWQWRYTDNMLEPYITNKLQSITELYGRN